MLKHKYFPFYVALLLMLCAFLLPIVACWWLEVGAA